jgi:hypothetical protein
MKGPKHSKIIEAHVKDTDGALAAGTAFDIVKRQVRSHPGWSGVVKSIQVVSHAPK